MDKRVWNLETATLSEEFKNRQEIDLDLCNNVKWASLFHKSKTIALVVGGWAQNSWLFSSHYKDLKVKYSW